jgi:ferredoxin
MSTFRIVIDRSLCSGFGACAEQAPTVFVLDSAGVADVAVAESDDPAVLEAAAACPMGAIEVYDAETLEQAA